MRRVLSENRERGVAMLLCLFALMILTSIGLGLMYMSNIETSINSNFRSSMEAFYGSKAGLEEGRDRIRYGFANYSIAPPVGLPSTANANGVIYILNPSSAADPVRPWDPNNAYFDDEICHENFAGLSLPNPGANVRCTASPGPNGWYTTVASKDPNTNTAAALSYKWVRITLKGNQSTSPYCSDGNCASAAQVCADPSDVNNIIELPLPAPPTCDVSNLRPVYMITSLAVNASGARRMTQYEVATVAVPNMPAAITLDGPVANPPVPPNFLNLPNSNMTFKGADHASGAECSNPVGNTMTAVGTVNAGSATAVTNAIPSGGNKQSNYTGTTPAPNIAPLTPNALKPFSTIAQLNTLVANISAMADQTFGNNPTGVNLGSDASPLITVVNGDFDMGTATGGGILLVTGKLSANGTPDFHGLVLVIGKGQVDLSGGGSGTWYGAILVANTQTDALGNTPGLPANPPGTPSLNWNGGGGANVQFDSCFTNGFGNRAVFRVLASREEMY